MKYIDEFRDNAFVRQVTASLKREVNPSRTYRFMEFCGGHTHTIYRYGLQGLLSTNIRMVHGPGCPVCVLPMARIQNAIELSQIPNVILMTYGDMMRVPGVDGKSLNHAKANGADIRMVYSAMDALKIAQENPDREVIFFAIGFETTTPPTALIIAQAQKFDLNNFTVFCNHVLTPSAIQSVLDAPEIRAQGIVPIDGFIGPGHVSAVIGSWPYEFFTQEYERPVVIAGFEPLDILLSIQMLVRQINEGRCEVENEYSRVVTRQGNIQAQALVAEIFELRPQFEWRGLGQVPYSGLKIKKSYARFDAEERFKVSQVSLPDHKACECSAILRGIKEPYDCKLFAKACTPETPFGSCMVSSEGACAAAYLYDRMGHTRKECAQLKNGPLSLNKVDSTNEQIKEERRKALLHKEKFRILFLTHTFNSLTQRLFVELTQDGHEVSIEFDINDEVTTEAINLFTPDIIIAPYLKRAIPEAIWKEHICLIVHPGIKGDRGPNALDWAILENRQQWGVTVLEANGEMDAGDIYSSIEYPMRRVRKSSLYRHEVTEAALKAVKEALFKIKTGGGLEPLDYRRDDVRGQLQPVLKQERRSIDWSKDSTREIIRKINSADGFPGVLDELCGAQVYLFDAHQESRLRGKPGDLLAQRHGAVCRATVDGAVWITHLKLHQPSLQNKTFKLPAVMALKGKLTALQELTVDPFDEVDGLTWRDICYKEENAVGFLYFEFYNGAMSTQQCLRLREAVLRSRQRPIKVLVLLGGCDFWSNGIHLNVIEASQSPADESWKNINAMNDLVESILSAKDQLIIAALRGNAGAGGVFLALAADRILARQGIILNPHYKSMGNLYGSEYWTYLLPKRVGSAKASQITQNRLPIGTGQAAQIGLIDECLSLSPDEFEQYIKKEAFNMTSGGNLDQLLKEKNDFRMKDESEKPLQNYRSEELERMRLNFYGFDPSYHVARYNFVHKIQHSWTPLHLAKHRNIKNCSWDKLTRSIQEENKQKVLLKGAR